MGVGWDAVRGGGEGEGGIEGDYRDNDGGWRETKRVGGVGVGIVEGRRKGNSPEICNLGITSQILNISMD